MALSNPINVSAVTNLGYSVSPLPLKFADGWRPHPILSMAGYGVITQGSQNMGARRIADFSGAVATVNENAAITDTALPTITAVNSTELQRGLSVGITSQAWDAILDVPAFVEILDELVMRELWDDVAFGANGAAALAASMTAVSTDTGTNASGDGLINCIDGVCSQGDVPTKAVVDRVGFRGLLDWFLANNQDVTSNPGLQEQARSFIAKYGVDANSAPDGFTGLEFYGCRIYLTNKAADFYTSGGDTFAIVGPDLEMMPTVQPPIHILGRPNPASARMDGDPRVVWTLGPNREIGIAKYRDTSLNVNGVKYDYVMRFDSILANTNIRAWKYNTTYV